MRLTLRLVLKMMSGVESALEEIAMKTRLDSKFYMGGISYHDHLGDILKRQRQARQALAGILDHMTDTGVGE